MSSGTERVERKLAAIFCADVADYSRLMHADEVQTLRTLTAHRAIMDGLISQHGGRITTRRAIACWRCSLLRCATGRKERPNPHRIASTFRTSGTTPRQSMWDAW